MSHKVSILDVAKPDFRDIRTYVKKEFGQAVWDTVNAEFKKTLKDMGKNPRAGTPIEELAELGLLNFRVRLVRHTRIVYEHTSNEVIVHMFIPTTRDFRTHLLKRMFQII